MMNWIQHRARILGLLTALVWLTAAQAAGLGGLPATLAPMLEKATPAVVNISTSVHLRTLDNPLLSEPFFRHFFGLPEPDEQPRGQKKNQSLGSGVIIDAAKGYVITNHHVVDKADEIIITLQDGRTLAAELIGSDPDTDVALLRVPADNLTEMPFADSDKLRVGDFVVAIGNPFGLGQTVTSGIISALGRTGLGIEGYEDFIQTDASINPGNSGGALVSLSGELVGMNTAILAPNGGNVGIGFAIPANMARKIVAHLAKDGAVHRGSVGLTMQDITPDLAAAFNLNGQGVLVAAVEPGSPAEYAGLRQGDIILKANGKPVESGAALRNHVGLMGVGEKVELEYLRDNVRASATVKIEAPSHVDGASISGYLAGAQLRELKAGFFGGSSGVALATVDEASAAWEVGFRPGDHIVAVNQTKVTDLRTLGALLNSRKKHLVLHIQRGDTTGTLVLR